MRVFFLTFSLKNYLCVCDVAEMGRRHAEAHMWRSEVSLLSQLLPSLFVWVLGIDLVRLTSLVQRPYPQKHLTGSRFLIYM